MQHKEMEAWLCRVYLIGGADAKAPHEIVPVYTPGTFHNGQLLAWNVTLPHGYFSAAPEVLEQSKGRSKILAATWQVPVHLG